MNIQQEEDFFEALENACKLLVLACPDSDVRSLINLLFCRFYSQAKSILQQAIPNQPGSQEPTHPNQIGSTTKKNKKQVKQCILLSQMLRVIADNPEGLQKEDVYSKTQQLFGNLDKRRSSQVFNGIIESRYAQRKNGTQLYFPNYTNIILCAPLLAERPNKSKDSINFTTSRGTNRPDRKFQESLTEQQLKQKRWKIKRVIASDSQDIQQSLDSQKTRK